jgi:hypothetical protein
MTTFPTIYNDCVPQQHTPISVSTDFQDARDPRDGAEVHVSYTEALIAAPTSRDGQKKSRAKSATKKPAAGGSSGRCRREDTHKENPSVSGDCTMREDCSRRCANAADGTTADNKRKRRMGPSADVIAQAKRKGAPSKRQKFGRVAAKGDGCASDLATACEASASKSCKGHDLSGACSIEKLRHRGLFSKGVTVRPICFCNVDEKCL